MSRNAAPVLTAYRDGLNTKVFCDHCSRWHYHGAHGCMNPSCRCPLHKRMATSSDACTCPIGAGDGHRVAHCHDPASPYADTGYILREVSP